MEIKVDVSNVDLTSVVGNRYDRDAEDEVSYTLGDRVAEQIVHRLKGTDEWNTAREMVRRIREDEIRKAVQQEVADALTMPTRQTNTWGEPTGPEVTLRDRIVEMAKKELSKTGDRYDRNESPTRQVLREMVDATIKKELASVVTEEKAKVVAAVRAKAADLIATAVKEGVGR